MKPDWRTINCPACSGLGVVSVYSAMDFEGPGECKECGGSGRLWVLPSDHTFMFPGGPARGSRPGAYNEAKEA